MHPSPEIDPKTGVDRFRFHLHAVRKHLRSSRSPTAKIIEQEAEVYRPAPELFDVDVWTFDRLIAEGTRSRRSKEPKQAAAALWRGELLEGVYYSWAETLRSHFRGQLLDVLEQLSNILREEDNHEAALTYVLQAISIDPFGEHLYRRAMEIYARLGRPTDVHRTYSDLEARLAEELKEEPGAETEKLKNRLLTTRESAHQSS